MTNLASARSSRRHSNSDDSDDSNHDKKSIESQERLQINNKLLKPNVNAATKKNPSGLKIPPARGLKGSVGKKAISEIIARAKAYEA